MGGTARSTLSATHDGIPVNDDGPSTSPDNAPGRIGFWVASALVVGNVIGAGIFLLPATLAPYGWNGVLGWFITLAGALCLAWVFAELSRTFPDAGGAFGFMRLALGEAPAFVGAWGYWVSVWVANAAIATGATAYLTRLVPAVESVPGLAPLVTVGIVWLVTWINLLGVRAVGGVQVVTTIIKLLPFIAVLALVAVRLGVDGASALAPFDPAALSWSGVIGATTLSLYALLGIESAAVPADRVKDPARTIPAATMFGTWLTGIISVVCCSAVVLMLPAQEVAASSSPFALFLSRSFGAWSGVFMALCAIVSAYGALNGWVLLSGELPAGMADSGRLPAWFGVRNAHGAPTRAIVLSSVLTTALVLANFSKSIAALFAFAILLATATNLVLYLFCSAGTLILLRRGAMKRSATLAAVAVGALLFSIWALYGSGVEALAWGAGLLFLGWPLHLATTRGARIAHNAPLPIDAPMSHDPPPA
ncbi:MAG: amino acid permease [Gemmatimonadetes bacterium]|nr:amino acid permease [Gemmatimonadota bacterium]